MLPKAVEMAGGNRRILDIIDEYRDVVPAKREFALHAGEELWVIERPAWRGAPRARCGDDYPGSGALMTRWAEPGQVEREVAVPLAHTDVRGSIACNIAAVELTQRFVNPYSSKIEAVYAFPLPDDAAVNEFLMTIGSRTIRGVIRGREEAQQIYEQARAQGHRAALMSQERSNIFTQRVANIEPGEGIDITIKYFHNLTYRGGIDGGYEFVFPMTIGPRFNPPCSAPYGGAGVGAVAYNAPANTGQATNVPYLRPTERSGTDVSVSLEIDAGVPIEKIECVSHRVDVRTDATHPSRASITLASNDSIPNRDFVLRYRIAGGQARGGMVTHIDERGGFFSMLIAPPEDLKYTQRGPVEFVFVVDCSGSMQGEPLEQARRAVASALEQLRPQDTFQIIRFSDEASAMWSRPISAVPENIERGRQYANGLASGGGTMMITPMKQALDFGSDGKRRRFVCFLTDGFIGNEAEVLDLMRDRLGEARVFSVGIGSAPNRTLLNAMARLGRGAAAYLSAGDDPREVMDLFMTRVSSAAMTDLRIDWGGLEVTDVYPKRLPDLMVDRPIVVTGRFRTSRGEAVGSGGMRDVRVSGRIGDERETISVPVALGASRAPGLPLMWARQRIAELDDRSASAGSGTQAAGWGSNRGEIKDVALRYGLVSAYTSLVAVDSLERTAGRYGTSVTVPVNLPTGTRYDTTVGER